MKMKQKISYFFNLSSLEENQILSYLMSIQSTHRVELLQLNGLMESN